MNDPGSLEESFVHAFVLGTGRCGTQTLARILDALPGCSVVHEATPPLLDEVTASLRGELSHADLVELLAATRDPAALGGDRLSAESNQRLSFILPALNEAFPRARYLWLIRDGREVVASMLHRHWYHAHEARLREPHHEISVRNRTRGDLVGEMSTQEWSRLGQFERICWYWSFTNRTIEKMSGQLGLQVLKLRLEDLSTELEAVMKFFDLDDMEAPTPYRANRARRGAPLPWTEWSRSQRRAFERLCGPTMNEQYPTWRETWNRISPGTGHLIRRKVYALAQVRGVLSVWRKRLRRN